MLDKPHLDEGKIVSYVNGHYQLIVDHLLFLPLGNSTNSWMYKVITKNKKEYFLKLKKANVYEPSLLVPKYLKDQGIEEVIAPIQNKEQQLWGHIDDSSVILYPFVQGETAAAVGMSPEQWTEIGTALKKIHATKLPNELIDKVQTEIFAKKWSDWMKEFVIKIQKSAYTDRFQREIAIVWKEKLEDINYMLGRAAELSQIIEKQQVEFVLCHSDIHDDNIFVSKEKPFIIDWDNVMLAPKERDLVFIMNTEGEESFFKGYGNAPINNTIAAYYLYEWAIQDMGDYADRVFRDDVGEETKQEAIQSFREIFATGNKADKARTFDSKNL